MSVSQPALTVAIRKLEDELGGPLFLRESKGLSLTALGHVMRTQLGRLEETRIAARRAAHQIVSCEKEMIDLGLMCTVAPGGLSAAFAGWHQQRHNTELVLHDVWGARAQELLLSGALDAAIIAQTQPLPKRFDTIPLIREPMVVAMSPDHPLAMLNTLTTEDLKGVEYVDRLRCEFRTLFFQDLHERDFSVDVVLRSEREDWNVQAIASGVGISIMPLHAAQSAGLETRVIEDFCITRSIDLVTVHGRDLRPEVRDLRAFLDTFDFPANPV